MSAAETAPLAMPCLTILSTMTAGTEVPQLIATPELAMQRWKMSLTLGQGRVVDSTSGEVKNGRNGLTGLGDEDGGL